MPAQRRAGQKAYNAAYYKANRDAIRERTRAYKLANPGKRRASDRRNRAAHNAARKAWRQRNIVEVRASERRRAGLPMATVPMPSKCECCGRAPPRGVLDLDHDHRTGVFRGWLCRRCNLAIGHLQDSEAGVTKALDYLVMARLRA